LNSHPLRRWPTLQLEAPPQGTPLHPPPTGDAKARGGAGRNLAVRRERYTQWASSRGMGVAERGRLMAALAIRTALAAVQRVALMTGHALTGDFLE